MTNYYSWILQDDTINSSTNSPFEVNGTVFIDQPNLLDTLPVIMLVEDTSSGCFQPILDSIEILPTPIINFSLST